MENEEAPLPARPSISFPVGFALLLILLFCMCGFLSCCLYWNRIRSLFQRFHDDGNAADNHMMSKEDQPESVLVFMPGDQVPKFVAMKCRCEPPMLEKVIVIGQKAS